MRTPRGYLVKETSQLCYDAVSMRREGRGGGRKEGGRRRVRELEERRGRVKGEERGE